MDLNTALVMEQAEMDKMKQKISSNSENNSPGPVVDDLISFSDTAATKASEWGFFEQTGPNLLKASETRRSSMNDFSVFFSKTTVNHTVSEPSGLTKRSNSNNSFPTWMGEKEKSPGVFGADMFMSEMDPLKSGSDIPTLSPLTRNNTLPMQMYHGSMYHPMRSYSPVQITRSPTNPFTRPGTMTSTSPSRTSSNSSSTLGANFFISEEKSEENLTQKDEINDVFQRWLNESSEKKEKPKSVSTVDWKIWDPLQSPVAESPIETVQPQTSTAFTAEEKEFSVEFEKPPELHQNFNQDFGPNTRESARQKFLSAVLQMRETLPFNDPLTNSGYLISPMMPKWQAAMHGEKDLDTLKLSINAEGLDIPVVFTCNINASIEHIVSQALCITHEDINEVTPSEYRLKVSGKQEILLSGTILSLYKLTQDCMRFEKDLHLQLVNINTVDKSLIRTKVDDRRDVLFDRLHKSVDKTTQISTETVKVVKDAFLSEIEKLHREKSLLSSLTENQQCDRVSQSVKAACQLLGGVETVDVTNAMQRLRNAVEEPPSNDNMTKQQSIEKAMAELSTSVCSFIDMFCKAADIEVQYSPLPPPINSCNVHDLIDVNVISAHRLPQMWANMYDEYYVSCDLIYGNLALGPSIYTKSNKPVTGSFVRISWDEWFTFPIKVSDIPRETKLCIILHGFPKRNEGSKEKSSSKELSWVNIQLFDHRNMMVQGPSLHGMLSAANLSTQDRTSASCSTKITVPDTVAINIEIMSSQKHKTIVYPTYAAPRVSSRKSSAGTSISSLDEGTQQDLTCVIGKNPFMRLTDHERDLVWKHRNVTEFVQSPGSLARVLRCVPSWGPRNVSTIYKLLENWPSIQPIEAFELLSVSFPDQNVRTFAVRCIQQGETDEIHDYLVQLVQALKYEIFYDNTLARFLLRSALGNVRICHKLYWLLSENSTEGFYADKYQLMLHALEATIGTKLKKEFEKEAYLVKMVNRAAEAVKYAKDSSRATVLVTELKKVVATIKNHYFHLPTDPALVSNGIDVEKSGYFTSNAIPLKLMFNNVEALPKHFHLMFKVGDDLRQDVLTMQLVKIMDKLWLAEGLDLKMITFICLSTGNKQGFIELVPNSRTLREIQSSYGLTGAFKDRPIAEWLQKHNPTTASYRKAEDNFMLSCAGYCVATYVLGICDRHNDNIMLRRSGHLFHIDFARFLGHVQMFGNIKRDRAPFVLTSDMAYVINGGDRPSSRFHDFVDICCQAFNIIRKHTHMFINLLSLMTHSGITELRHISDLKYVYDALKPGASDSEATAMFTRLIETSLSSSFTRINFFIHTLAQMRLHGNESEDKKSLSFASKAHTAGEDGTITSAIIVGYQKKYEPEKHYLFCVRLLREFRSGENYVFRTFNEFAELHQKLSAIYSSWKLPSFPNRVIVGRSQIKQVAERRKFQLNSYLHHLLQSHMDVSKNDLVYTFFHPLLRDEKASTSPVVKQPATQRKYGNSIGGEIKFSVHHKNNALLVMIMYCRNLVSPDGNDPDPYVKTYLLPDAARATKRKTKVAKKTLHPTYNEMIVYDVSLSDAMSMSLNVSVWNYETLNENNFMGGVNLQLSMMDLSRDNTRWYPLTSSMLPS